MADSGRDESRSGRGESPSGGGEASSGERVRQRKKKSGRQRERGVLYSGEKCPAVEKKVPGRRIESFLSGRVRGYTQTGLRYVRSAVEKKVL